MVGFGDYGLVRLLLRLLGLDWRRCEGGLEEAVTVLAKGDSAAGSRRLDRMRGNAYPMYYVQVDPSDTRIWSATLNPVWLIYLMML